MKEVQSLRFRNRIALKQARSVILLAFLLGVIFSVLQLYTDYSREKEKLDVTALQVINTTKQTAIQAAYLVDSALAREVVNGLFEYRPIVAVQIFDDLKTELASLKRPLREDRLQQVSDILFGKEIKYTIQLVANTPEPTNVGNMVVSVDPRYVAEAFFERAALIVISGLMRYFVLAIIILFAFYSTITKPLLDIISSMMKIDPEKPEKTRLPIPKGHKKDEFGLLVNSANQLLQTIDDNVKAIKKAEETLRESEERFRSIYAQSPIGIELYNSDGKLIDVNPACLDIFGIESVEEVKGFDLFKDPNLSDDAKERLKNGEVVKSESSFDFEIVKEKSLYHGLSK